MAQEQTPDTAWYPNACDGLTVHQEGDDLVVLHREAQQIHQLSETAATIFRQCDGTQSPADLAAHLCANYDVEPDQAQRDVLVLLEELKTKQLVH